MNYTSSFCLNKKALNKTIYNIVQLPSFVWEKERIITYTKNDCLSNGSPDEAKDHSDSLTRQGPVDFGIVQNTAESMRQKHSPSLIMVDSLGSFSVVLSIMHGTDMIIPGSPIFLKYLPLKSLGTDASQVPTVTSDLRTCSNSVLTDSKADHFYFCKYVLNGTVLEIVCLCQSYFCFLKTGCTWLDIWPS